ncbi:MBL fold hydrolase [Cypionkella aquatica]|uniref:MBL fold hydrolase n=1 Tax=Cypionkella aquatica TaxID=1756042 RepID=A0AA37U8D2_9RHOB|nr:MBL fold metallo-hydrolase [Cypionkella aquatica]GLS87161.1 MBL fold hydrolase [Cypionkella aquatica]
MQMGAEQIAGGVWRLRAGNPSPMTGSGTNSYVLLGPDGAVLIDPGPALPDHLAGLLVVLGNAPLRAVLLSHPHLDHSAGLPALQAATGARSYGFGAADAGRSMPMQRLVDAGLTGGGEGVDADFIPDVAVKDGEILQLAGLQIEAIHTPGHMGAHLCFALAETLFSGDHVMGWSSSLISPPDGDMGQYMESLAKLAARDWQHFYPGHGEIIVDPAARLLELTRHRRAREAAILAALAKAPACPDGLAAQLYTDTPPALLGAAARNILAHLIDLHERKLVTTPQTIAPDAFFHLI